MIQLEQFKENKKLETDKTGLNFLDAFSPVFFLWFTLLRCQ
jgi:hypothetical protein